MRVVIAEDLTLLRDGLARLLRAHDFDVVAEVGDPVALARALDEQAPVDVVIMDVRMPPTFTNEGLVAAMAAFDRPSAINPITSRSRGLSRASGALRWCRLSSASTTFGSSTVPPAATRRTASTNVCTSETRSLSR